LTIFQSPLESDSDRFQEQLIVNLVELDNPVLLDERTEKIIADLRTSLKNFELSDRCDREIILANGKTNTICYTAQDEGRKLKYLLALTLNGDRAYYLTYIAEPDKYDKFLGTAKEMMKSFQIVDPK
jgi:serine/threonine-protein kinase